MKELCCFLAFSRKGKCLASGRLLPSPGRTWSAAACSAPYTNLSIGRLLSACPSRHARESNPRVSAESARQQSPGREPREGTSRGISPARAMQDFWRDSTTCFALTGLSRFIANPGFGRFAASPWAFLPRAFGAGLVYALARLAIPKGRRREVYRC